MKRIILGLGVLLMLVQNGFAMSNAEFDAKIAEQTKEIDKQIWRCNKEQFNNKYYGDPRVCIKALKMVKKDYPDAKSTIHILSVAVGILYEDSKKDYVKAYEYYMKAVKLGSTDAQNNLDILCSKHSWVCK